MTTNNFPGIGYNNVGRDFNFFAKTSVTATTFGGTSVSGQQPDIVITFPTQTVMFLNEGSGVVEYSFNGNTVHGELNSATSSVGLAFDNRVVSAVWFRIQSGSTGPIVIATHAYATR